MSLTVPFPSRSFEISGGGIATVFSGTGVLLGVFCNPLSGAQASYSGSVIRVQDAVSGMAALASGNIMFFNLDFGNQSGFNGGVNSAMLIASPSDIGYMEGFCNSGLVIQGAAGWNVAVSYNK